MRRPSNTSKQHLDANGRGVEPFGIGLMFAGFCMQGFSRGGFRLQLQLMVFLWGWTRDSIACSVDMHVSILDMSAHGPVFVCCESCAVVDGGSMMTVVTTMQNMMIAVVMTATLMLQ